jgi:phage/plasmid-associated DNA primase
MIDQDKSRTVLGSDITASGLAALAGNDGLASLPCPENHTSFNPTHQVHLCTGNIPAHPIDEAALLSRFSTTIFPAKYRTAIANETDPVARFSVERIRRLTGDDGISTRNPLCQVPE